MTHSPEINVLLVDDSYEDRMHFQDILMNYPEYQFQTHQCGNGTEGLEALRRRPFDCIVLDYNMPENDGLQVLKELRVKNIHVPVVMLTGEGDERIAVESLRSGAQEYLPKVDANLRKLPNAIIAAMERKEQELNFLQLVNNDSLTGVSTRHCFLDQLDKAIMRADRNARSLALMFIDVDEFKHVNDTYGHDAGDFVLKELTKRLRSGLRGCDTLARLGGDEFVILLEDMTADCTKQCRVIAGRLIGLVQKEPFMLNGTAIAIDISIGISLYPQMARNKTELLEKADRAMYQSKRSINNYFTFAQEETQAA